MLVVGQLCFCECASHAHTVQAKIIAGLAERRGGDLAVGLEMVQEQFQVCLVRAGWGGECLPWRGGGGSTTSYVRVCMRAHVLPSVFPSSVERALFNRSPPSPPLEHTHVQHLYPVGT